MLFWIRSVLLSPVLILQALAARKMALILPEPPGDRSGSRGNGPPLRLLVSGDSAAAGVGAEHQDEALLGRLVEQLAIRHTVKWRLEARSGATTQSTLRHLAKVPAMEIDVATTSLGVNDVTSGAGLGRWLRNQAALRALLRGRFGARLIVVAGLPPVHLFPGLPQPLRWHLGLRAKEFDKALVRDLTTEPDCCFVPLNVTEDASAMAADGFHPGPEIYALWAQRISDCVRQRIA